MSVIPHCRLTHPLWKQYHATSATSVPTRHVSVTFGDLPKMEAPLQPVNHREVATVDAACGEMPCSTWWHKVRT